MILFRCPSCGKSYSVSDSRVGERLQCTCEQDLCVPHRSGQSAKYRSWSALFIETFIYGGGGAIIGFVFGLVLVTQLFTFRMGKYLIAASTLLGFFIGFFGGERGINWIGRIIRDRENK